MRDQRSLSRNPWKEKREIKWRWEKSSRFHFFSIKFHCCIINENKEEHFGHTSTIILKNSVEISLDYKEELSPYYLSVIVVISQSFV